MIEDKRTVSVCFLVLGKLNNQSVTGKTVTRRIVVNLPVTCAPVSVGVDDVRWSASVVSGDKRPLPGSPRV